MSPENRNVATLPTQIAFLGAFFGLVGLGSVGLIVLFRSGLPIPWRLLATDITVLLSATLAPFLLPARLQQRCFAAPSLVPVPGLAVLAATLFGLVNSIGYLLGWVYFGIALIALYRARRAFVSIGATQFAVGAIAALMTAIYLFGTFNQLGYSTIYTPEIAQIGTLKNDAYYHPAIAHMIMNFGKLSPGYDGLGSIHYHLGSHIWFAALAAIGHSTPLFAYPIGQLVVAIPFLYWSVCIAGLLLARYAVRSVTAMPVFVLATAVFIDQIGWTSYYASESYTLSIAIMICFLPLLLLPTGTIGGNRHISGGLVAALPVSFVLACVKLSVGFLWGVAAGYAAVRRYSPWKAATWIFLAALAATLLLSFGLFRKNAVGVGGGFELFYMFRTGYLYDGIIASLLVPVATVLLGAWLARRQAGDSLRAAFRTSATFPLELVVVVTGAAMLPGSVMVLQSGNWWYFTNVAHWFAFPIFAALVLGDRLWLMGRTGRLSLIPIATLIAAVAAWLIWQAGIKPESPLRAGLEPMVSLAKRVVRESAALSQPTANPPSLGRDAWWQIASAPLFTPEIAEVFAATPGARLAALVRAAADGRPKGFAVYVPPDNRSFWELTPWCATQSLMIPSITGIPMLYGLPPAYRNCTTEFNGFTEFPDAASRDVDHDALCRRANLRSIQRVFVLRSLSEPDRNQIVDCGAKSRAS